MCDALLKYQRLFWKDPLNIRGQQQNQGIVLLMSIGKTEYKITIVWYGMVNLIIIQGKIKVTYYGLIVRGLSIKYKNKEVRG